MNNEIWKDIPGFNGVYQVNNFGVIKSLKFNKEKILKTYDSNGYRKVDLQINKNKRKCSVHRLVAAAFLDLDLDDESCIVNHIDGVKHNNNLQNLELVSIAENTADGIKRKKNTELTKFITYIGIEKWAAQYLINDINIFLGEFSSLKEALIAVQTAQLISIMLKEKAL